MSKQNNDEERVYHELCQKYGQVMTGAEVAAELKLNVETAARLMTEGWYGRTQGRRMKTIAFARQFVALR